MTDLWEIFGRRRRRRKPAASGEKKNCRVAVERVVAPGIVCSDRGKKDLSPYRSRSITAIVLLFFLFSFSGHISKTGNHMM